MKSQHKTLNAQLKSGKIDSEKSKLEKSLLLENQRLKKQISLLEKQKSNRQSNQTTNTGDNQARVPADANPYNSHKSNGVLSVAREVILAIRDKNMQKLSTFVHPNKNVRFSPYGYVDVKNDLTFSAAKIKNLWTDKTKYRWGVYDGSGEPIILTFQQYYSRFIYDRDFANAKDIAVNRIIGTGNSLINISDVYPNATFVEYHFPGSDPKYNGMDWRSLRLVFESKGGKLYLVGIIHDEWTI